ncbi:MAG: hypothetical protein RLY31_72 [Bacteroidota bacterium]|jgi:predicted RNase H-related nuclease YkuK (DUF458 family)
MEPWRKLNGETLEMPIKEAVAATLDAQLKAGFKLKVCIGTDSQVRQNAITFATVIVFLREKSGGFMFVHHSNLPHRLRLKERMILEVSKSVDIAYQLCDLVRSFQVDLEVHADINQDPAFLSNKALREAMGYIKGMGFEFKAKPDAFASSCCADKVV